MKIVFSLAWNIIWTYTRVQGQVHLWS